MAFLKAETTDYKHLQALLSLNMTVALIRAVENVRLTIFIFYQTQIFNGSNQRNGHMRRHQNLHVLVALALYFQNHHHLCLQLSVGLSSNICREARFLEKKICQKYVIKHRKVKNRGALRPYLGCKKKS